MSGGYGQQKKEIDNRNGVTYSSPYTYDDGVFVPDCLIDLYNAKNKLPYEKKIYQKMN